MVEGPGWIDPQEVKGLEEEGVVVLGPGGKRDLGNRDGKIDVLDFVISILSYLLGFIFVFSYSIDC